MKRFVKLTFSSPPERDGANHGKHDLYIRADSIESARWHQLSGATGGECFVSTATASFQVWESPAEVIAAIDEVEGAFIAGARELIEEGMAVMAKMGKDDDSAPRPKDRDEKEVPFCYHQNAKPTLEAGNIALCPDCGASLMTADLEEWRQRWKNSQATQPDP